MKYRVQLNALFNNADANSILNHMESIKTDIYKPNFYTEVAIERKSEKCDYDINLGGTTIFSSVDFDVALDNHNGNPTGVSDFFMRIDVSFMSSTAYASLLNYIESIKANALTTSGYERNCRFFECKHDEKPLGKDGVYSYTDFDGTIITFS